MTSEEGQLVLGWSTPLAMNNGFSPDLAHFTTYHSILLKNKSMCIQNADCPLFTGLKTRGQLFKVNNSLKFQMAIL